MSTRTPSASGGASMKQGTLKFASSKRTTGAAGAKKVPKKSSATTTRDHSAEVKEEEIKEPTEKEHLQKLSTPHSSAESLNQDQKPEHRPELNITDVRWRKLFAEAKAKRNGLPLAHGNKEDEIKQILRVFDLNYDYGPCIGVNRLERWERANALGLNPPLEIRDILSTRQGAEEYPNCVFEGEV